MQIKNIILSTLLAIEGVSAAHSHSKGSSKSISSSIASSSEYSSTTSKESSTSSKESSSTATASTTGNSSYVPGHNWKTLTPDHTYQCGFTDFTSTFGVAVKTITLNSQSSPTKEKRDLIAPTQAVDVVVGQVRAVAKPSLSSSDSIVTTTTLTRTKTVVSTSVATLSVNATALNETGSYNQTNYNITINGTFINATYSNISFYGNSSLLNDTSLNNTASYLNATHKVNTTSYNSTLTECSASLPDFFDDVSCQTNTTLSITLEKGVLRDSSGKIGSIVSSHQFQFNGPWPAEGTLYAVGWSITPDNNLALGDNDIFYECLTGDGYYDLFDEFIGSQCIPIQLISW